MIIRRSFSPIPICPHPQYGPQPNKKIMVIQQTERKSFTHRGFIQESLDKRNRTFTSLEKKIQDVLDQNKKTKQLLKDFLTPYKESRQKFITSSPPKNFSESKKKAFITINKEEELLDFMSKLEDYNEENALDENKEAIKTKFSLFDIEKYVEKKENHENMEEKLDFIHQKSGVNLRRFINEIYEQLNTSQVIFF